MQRFSAWSLLKQAFGGHGGWQPQWRPHHFTWLFFQDEAVSLAALLRQGASVMVCGGDAMARAVRAEFDSILAPLGQSVRSLQDRGRYLEDIF